MNSVDIGTWQLAAVYLLLIFPLAVILLLRIPMFSDTLISVVRMTVQLLFVGFYLQLVFDLNNIWVTAAWIMVMIIVADVSIARGCGLRFKSLGFEVFIAMLGGTLIPLAFFMFVVLYGTPAHEAQFVIPICGMILGNCLRAVIVGLRSFYEALRKHERAYLLTLAQGASLKEAVRPYMRDACQAALAPTVATMATVGLVALPGMMTGVILGGGNPMAAIKYQIAIMIAIFSGTALTVVLAIHLTMIKNFNACGVLNRKIFIKL